ncbi:hypothetical protein BCR32DRAFT_289000 [Anaeromyces robustus]|uniref:CBM10 domain-containing protein n=1 Tax=Anaeromyces robustus TaxID=1754192 RepID=A0A1Y1XQ45_9FUNG|nr:hypothetical protein BCR32DRAFT_289000 [Anaeromyces robustus]|eukprot:ORX87879.1 hypothetical protein BCR32DRAFT_289000 [Anaeromyces robustus]
MTDDDYKEVIENAQVSQNDFITGNFKNVNVRVNFTITDNGKTIFFPETTLQLDGNYARSFSKPNFNIKLPTEYNNRKNFHLHSSVNDKSHIKQKLVCDILNRVGLPSTQSTFVRLTINGNLYGLYTLMDTPEPSNIKRLYNTKKDDLKIIQCKYTGFTFTYGTANYCVSDDSDDKSNIQEFNEFLAEVDKAQTIEDLEKIMNIDIFLKYIAIDWIIGSSDHLLINGNNVYFYKSEINNKWDIIYYDFDNTFGQGIGDWVWTNGKNKDIKEYYKLSFKQFTNDQRIFDVAVNNDDTRFIQNLKDILTFGFNPVLLNLHINNIKELIDPYIREEFTSVNDQLPGRINKKGLSMESSYEEYQMATEYKTTNYTDISGQINFVPGIKFWIENSFENVCNQYKFDKDEILDNAVTLTPISFFTRIKNGELPYDDNSIGQSAVEEPKPAEEKCWSEEQGFPCCKGCVVIYTENNEKWGIENDEWCGINKTTCQEDYCNKNNEYECCETCTEYFSDNTGRYGYENEKWCLLKDSC